MRALEIDRYGSAAEALHINSDAQVPPPSAGEILIDVQAASVNPVDCAIRRGYGREVFRKLGRVGDKEFPVRLGRDASGVVIAVGSGVEKFRVGDRVFTAPSAPTIAERAVVAASEAAEMPRNVTFVEAASLPFVAMTTWHALVDQVGAMPNGLSGKRVLITRGAGGVGSFAIQLVKAWGGYVASICSTRNVEFVKGLGADLVIDYTKPSSEALLRDFDVVFDSSFDKETQLLDALRTQAGASYITITSPKVKLADQFGVELGAKKAEELLESRRAAQAALGRHYYWGHMKPNGAALAQVAQLVEAKKIRPLVDRVFALDDAVAAQEYCESGQAQGKIVFDMTIQKSH
jgi:NADPH:quinone reductase-like Zn-dependent oxidoreductase